MVVVFAGVIQGILGEWACDEGMQGDHPDAVDLDAPTPISSETALLDGLLGWSDGGTLVVVAAYGGRSGTCRSAPFSHFRHCMARQSLVKPGVINVSDLLENGLISFCNTAYDPKGLR